MKDLQCRGGGSSFAARGGTALQVDFGGGLGIFFWIKGALGACVTEKLVSKIL